jgi:adenosylcobinamide kinase/adenosylcobinamide-phosphate guanylyltransferase
MEVVLLGTGSADGWPNPFCDCTSCAWALATGAVRGQTAALVDGRLLLDCGPDVPRGAARLGRSLAGVRHVLLTHGHWDHAAGAALLARTWAGRTEPLDVVGPPAALDAMRDWVAPTDQLRWLPVAAGDRRSLDGYEVVVLEAAHRDHDGPGVLYDVTAPDGGRLLHATDTGPLPPATLDAVRDRAYDVVFLEETFGDRFDHGTDHLDLATFADAVHGLRTAGAAVDTTDVVAVHLGHRNPPGDELARRLADVGARAVPDGTSLGTSPHRPGHRVLVLGGARSGKSWYAERLLAGERAPTYVATASPGHDDPEWADRVRRHRERRGPRWRTVETLELAALLRAAGPGEPVLVDCLSLWLARVLDDAGAWDRGRAADADQVLAREVDDLVDAWSTTRAAAVLVSNEVGSGVVPATVSGRRYRDELGRLNARMAAAADTVVLLVAGVPVPVKSPPPIPMPLPTPMPYDVEEPR